MLVLELLKLVKLKDSALVNVNGVNIVKKLVIIKREKMTERCGNEKCLIVRLLTPIIGTSKCGWALDIATNQRNINMHEPSKSRTLVC